MKPIYRSTSVTPFIIRQLLACSVLIACAAIPIAATVNAAEPPGVLTLYQNIDSQEKSCSFDLPGTSSNRVVYFRPKTDSVCPKTDGTFKPHSIRIRHAASATKFLLTDDVNCNENAKNRIELGTIRPIASLEKMGLDKLTDYRGLITNRGIDSNALTIGFKLLNAKGIIEPGNLTCIRVSTSGGLPTGSN